MRKALNKKIVIITLALLLVLSVGYALFSQNINVSGTATAKGSFEITTTCSTASLSDNFQTLVDGDGIDKGYKSPICTVENDTVTYSATLDYPGASKYFLITFKNTGTISASFTFEQLNAIMDANGVLKTYDSSSNSSTPTSTSSEGYEFVGFEGGGIAFADADGVYVSPDSEKFADYTPDMDVEGNPTVIVLPPNHQMYMIVSTKWPTDNKYSQKGVYYEASQDVTLPWSQYTK